MAIISKIQQKTGCLVTVILVSLLLFVLTDFFNGKNGGGIFGSGEPDFAEINGKKIKYSDFSSKTEELLLAAQASNPEMVIDDQMRESYKEQAWNYYLQEQIFKPQYNKLGLMVSKQELKDMTYGDFVDPQIVSAFKNPQTGLFDKNAVIKFLQETMPNDDKAHAQWMNFENSLIENTIGKKYGALVKGAIYTTTLEAQAEFDENAKPINSTVVSLAYATIPDSEIKLTDDDLREELKKNSFLYEQEASRDIEYVTFSTTPTQEDTLTAKNWIYGLAEGFKTAKYDSLFVDLNGSEARWDVNYKTPGSFDKTVDPLLFSMDSGATLGPVYDNGTFNMYKISSIRKDTVTSFKASHIIFPLNGDSAGSYAKAMNMMNEIRSGVKKFEELAMPNSDGSGYQGGDVGYINPNSTNVPREFYMAASQKPVGELFLVLADGQVHIGKVTSEKTNKKIKVAILSQKIISGANTVKTASTNARLFAEKARNAKDFGKLAENMKLSKKIAPNVKETDTQIPGLDDVKSVLQWVYADDMKVGNVSDEMDFADKYVVAKCVKIRLKGLPSIEDIRPTLELAARNSKKALKLKEKFAKALKESKTVQDLATKLGSIAQFIPSQNFMSESLPYVGYEMKLLGAIFGTEKGKFTPIIAGQNGVYVAFVEGPAQGQTPPANFDEMKNNKRLNNAQAADQLVLEALKKKANIKDNRYKF